MNDPLPRGIRPASLWPLAGILVTLAALPLMGWFLIFSAGVGDAIARAIPTFWFPEERKPDLEIAAGEPGYLASLKFAGPQLHFRDDADRTYVATRVWVGDKSARITVATYDGPPSRDVAPESLDRWSFPGLLVLRVVDADGNPRADARVWCVTRGADQSAGPALAEHGALNLAVIFGGTVSVWTEGGPKCEIEMEPRERVSATLGPSGLVIDARESR